VSKPRYAAYWWGHGSVYPPLTPCAEGDDLAAVCATVERDFQTGRLAPADAPLDDYGLLLDQRVAEPGLPRFARGRVLIRERRTVVPT
jgi:hypothetical protein